MDPLTIPLRDIHLPLPVPWWPPAPGWWLLALVAVVCASIWFLRRRQQRADVAHPAVLTDEVWRRWDTLKALCGATPYDSIAVRELSEFLRRVTLSLQPRRKVAGLTGDAWLEFLDEALGGRDFRDGPGRMLVTLPYQSVAASVAAATPAIDLQPCVDLCERWLHAALTPGNIMVVNHAEL